MNITDQVNENLYSAVFTQDTKLLKKILAEKPKNLNIHDSLCYVSSEDVESVQLLLPYATVKQRGIALKIAATQGKTAIVKELVFTGEITSEQKAWNNEALKDALTVSTAACKKRKNESAEVLYPFCDIKDVLTYLKGATLIYPGRVYTELEYEVAKLEKNEKYLQVLKNLNAQDPNEGLKKAAQIGDVNALDYILPKATSIQARAEALSIAASLGYSQCVRKLAFRKKVGIEKMNYNKEALKQVIVNNPNMSGDLDDERLMCANLLVIDTDVNSAFTELSQTQPESKLSFLKKFLDEEIPLNEYMKQIGQSHKTRSEEAVEKAIRVDEIGFDTTEDDVAFLLFMCEENEDLVNNESAFFEKIEKMSSAEINAALKSGLNKKREETKQQETKQTVQPNLPASVSKYAMDQIEVAMQSLVAKQPKM